MTRVALFNQAYQNVYDNAGDEYLALFSKKTLQFVRAPDQHVFVPPFNLIEIVLLLPLELVLSKEKYRAVNNFVLSVLYAPYLTAIALYESRLHRRRTKALNGDFDDEELEDDDDEDDTRDWNKICARKLPSTKTDLEVLEELSERLKTVEALMKTQQ